MANMMRAKAKAPRTVAIIVGLVLAAAAPARGADDVAAFFKGKTLRILVGSGVGSGYDITARTLARAMPAYIPGHPLIIVQNQPGAGGMSMTNSLNASGPFDGTVIGAPFNGTPTMPLLQPQSARFDADKLIYLGSTNRETQVMYVWHTVPIQKLENLNRSFPPGIDTIAKLGGCELPVRRLAGELGDDFGYFRHGTAQKEVVRSEFNDFALPAQRFQDTANACFRQLDQRCDIAALRRSKTVGIGDQRRDLAPNLFVLRREPDAMSQQTYRTGLEREIALAREFIDRSGQHVRGKSLLQVQANSLQINASFIGIGGMKSAKCRQ